MTADKARTILLRRAEALARPAAPPVPADQVDLITFALGDELGGVESRFVVEIFRPVEIAPLPGAELPIFGVAVWRGGLLTVLDLRSPALSGGAPEQGLYVIVLGAEGRTVGIVATGARELVSIRPARIHPPGSVALTHHVVGISEDGILVLDASGLLQSYA